MNVFSRALSGMRDSSATAGPIVSGCLRDAPFGVPLVPEVRITTRPVSTGGAGAPGVPRRAHPSGRRGRLVGLALVDPLVERRFGALPLPRRLRVVPADEALAALAGVLEQLG